MNKIRDIKLTAGNLSLRAELFAHGDITLAKLCSSDSSYFEGTNLDYGWAFRAPDDKPNRMKGMTVALGKAMDSAMLAPKLRHDLLIQLKQSTKAVISNTPDSHIIHDHPSPLPDGWTSIKDTRLLQCGSRNYQRINPYGIHGLQFINGEGQTEVGGFGTGIRQFWIGLPDSHIWESDIDNDYYRIFNPIAWRYKPKPEANPWRDANDTRELKSRGKNYNCELSSITDLQLKLRDGSIHIGGFGTGLRKFWVSSPHENTNWYAQDQVIAWRYADA